MVGAPETANELTNKIIDFLYQQGVYSWRQNSGGVFDSKKGIYRLGSKKGVSDILGLLLPAGRLLAVEVKIGKDRLSPEQEGFLKNIEHFGGLVFVAKNFEEFKLWWKNQKK